MHDLKQKSGKYDQEIWGFLLNLSSDRKKFKPPPNPDQEIWDK